MKTAQFPSLRKTAKLKALRKAGELFDVNNCRQISALPVLSKVIERHVYNCLFKYLTDNSLIYANQSGFRQKFSTKIALIGILDLIMFDMDRNEVTGMVSVDYEKAFDMVDHSILIRKLEVYKLDTQALLWFTSYLNDRKQFG